MSSEPNTDISPLDVVAPADQTTYPDSDDQPHTPAPPPFDDPTADIILRSSDGVHFHVFKLILVIASPFFRDMFSLPQASADAPLKTDRIMPVTESSTVLELLLRFCYPVRNPELTTIEVVQEVIEVARKYDVAAAMEHARERLAILAEKESVRAYAIACRYGLEAEARTAAKHSARHSFAALIEGDAKELSDISGMALQRLLKYHLACQGAVATPSWGTLLDAPDTNTKCTCSSQWVKDGAESFCVKSWFKDFMTGVTEALKDQPWAGRVTDRSILKSAVADTTACDMCRPGVYASLVNAMDELVIDVEKRTSEINLEFVSAV